jgi:hypothetical protein
MKKRAVRLSPLFFLVLFGLILSPFHISDRKELKTVEGFRPGIAWAQTAERDTQDSYYVQMMKQFRMKVDEWLKDLNKRIESEDVTRFEVRFLEILRSILEWMGEKIDAQIESGEKKPKRKMRGEEV